jgi:hypothetical protein
MMLKIQSFLMSKLAEDALYSPYPLFPAWREEFFISTLLS